MKYLDGDKNSRNHCGRMFGGVATQEILTNPSFTRFREIKIGPGHLFYCLG